MDRRLALLAALGLLAACANTPAATNAPPRVVPWAALPPAHETIPTHTVPASPDPAAAEAAPACRPGQVAVSFSGTGASAGSAFADLTVRKIAGPDCAVAGRPRLAFLDDGVPNGVGSRAIPRTAGVGLYSYPVLLTASATARAQVVWSYGACEFDNHLLVADHVRATLTGGVSATTRVWASRDGHSVHHGKDQIGCYLNAADGNGHGIEPVGVGDLEPTGRRAAGTTTAWAHVTARPVQLRLTGAPGQPLDFDITLTARHDVSLATCPDYELLMADPETNESDDHQLNCAAVPYRDTRGTPYLPAGVPVTFAMRTTAPAHPAQKVIWSLADGDSPGGLERGPVLAGMYSPTASSPAATPSASR